MGTTIPLKNKEDIRKLKQFFLDNGQIRNYAIVTLGVNTSMRISDLLQLCWGDVYMFRGNRYRQHICIVEQKTNKISNIPLNDEVMKALEMLKNDNQKKQIIKETDYLFKGKGKTNKPLSRTQVYRIITKAAKDLNMEGIISCHSMRKTFGYHAWKQGVPPALIMSIYNHSSLEVTKHYLSIDQEDKDEVFMNLNL